MSNISIKLNRSLDIWRGLKAQTKSCVRNNYYCKNVRTGWNTASRLSRIRNESKTQAVCTKFYGVISKTKIRKVDLLPALFYIISTPIPIPGSSIAAYKLGRILNKFLRIKKPK